MPTSRAALATIGHRRARIPRRVAPRQSPPPFPAAPSEYPEAMPHFHAGRPPAPMKCPSCELLYQLGLEPDKACTFVQV